MEENKIFINYKWGSKPLGKYNRKGLSKKWFFYKPTCGNLTPAPCAPFSSFNSIPYSGGYPTGYNNYKYNAWGGTPGKESKTIIGFTHFSGSGVGNIDIFFNYFLIKPTNKPSKIIREFYDLGKSSITTKDYYMEANVGNDAIKYLFSGTSSIKLIPGFNGLKTDNNIVESTINIKDNIITSINDYGDIKIYWAIKIIKCDSFTSNEKEITINGNNIEFIISYSFIDINDSIKLLDNDFEYAKNEWNKIIKKIDIEGSYKEKNLFYSALYHSLKNPFIYKDHLFNALTLWDEYKTLFPLIFLIDKEHTNKLLSLFKVMFNEGHFTNSKHLTYSPYDEHVSQAISLLNIIISTAKLYGYNVSDELLNMQKEDIEYRIKEYPYKERSTHNLDLIDAICSLNNAYSIDKYLYIKEDIKNYFNKECTILSNNYKYYEGSNYNYSFRVSASTGTRLKYTNKKALIKELDRFFGFTSSNVLYFKNNTLPSIIKSYGKKVNRFEGLNNEADMESMYMYGLLGEYDKQNRVLNDVMEYNFNNTTNGVPGNDDSGALSSFLVFNILGLFPISGTNRFLIGLPKLDKATFNLDNKFIINVHRDSYDSIYIDKVLLNNKKLDKYEITIEDIRNGGILDIFLK